jgi:hypothetical protein
LERRGARYFLGGFGHGNNRRHWSDVRYSHLSPKPKVLLTGATGYVGGRLLKVLEKSDVNLRCMVRRPENLLAKVNPSTEIVTGDVSDLKSLNHALLGIDTAFYLIHSMQEGLINTGAYMVDRSFFAYPLVAISATEYGLPQTLAAMVPDETILVRMATDWQPVGCPEDIPLAEEFIKKYFL